MGRKSVTPTELDNILNDRLGKLENSLAEMIMESVTRSIAESFEKLWGPKIQQNTNDIADNTTAIEKLTARVEALEAEKVTKTKEITNLYGDLDDMKNRSMRNNLVIKGIPEPTNNEKEDIRSTVLEFLAGMTDQNEEDVDYVIDRCHRGGRRNMENKKPRNIYMNFICRNVRLS